MSDDGAWGELERELDAWAAAGRVAEFWWRDDDAVTVTAELARLAGLADGVALALAVIPHRARPDLADWLEPDAGITVLQHGFAHTNHAGPLAKSAELGGERPLAATLAELVAGRTRLKALFGPRFLALLVPPWNRIAPEVAAALPAAGFAGLSTAGPRSSDGSGPSRVNTHLDPVDWRGGRGFVGEAAALAQAVGHLARRRRGEVDALEPTGLLTHHLMMNARCWDFTERFLARTTAHPATRWLDAATALATASPI